MGKKSRQANRAQAESSDPAGIAPRQPCPCGSGKRYKACHGSPSGPARLIAKRPFEGLPSECDVVALRELVPSATAPLPLRDGDRDVLLCTLLPMAAPALVRPDGAIWLGLQVQHHYGDPSRDLAATLLAAQEAAPGSVVGLKAAPGDGPRLQDLVRDEPLEITVHEGFDFWLGDASELTPQAASSLEQANAAVTPTQRLDGVEAAYWVDAGSKEHLRWVLPDGEDDALDALTRLHAAGRDVLVPDARLVGMFRAHGLLTPVWDLPVGTGAASLEGPMRYFAQEYAAALTEQEPLSTELRAVRAGLANRQLTIR